MTFKGKRHSEETKKRMSESRMGDKNPMFGKHPSKEARARMSEVRSGKNNSFYGKRHSAESKQRMSEAHKGLRHSEKTKQKMSEAHTGVLHSDEARKKISESQRGEKHWNWKGGPATRGSDWFWQRIEVRMRDNYLCQCCGDIDGRRENGVHHWVPYRLCRSNDLGNLITLCHGCHTYIEYNFVVGFPSETEVIAEGFK